MLVYLNHVDPHLEQMVMNATNENQALSYTGIIESPRG